jgi:hypothetical protein
LQLVNPVAVLHVVVGVVEQIEHLRLKLQLLAFLDGKTAGQSNIDPFQPRTIERIQADPGVGPPPLMPPAVFAVLSLKAVSFRFPLAPSQLSNDMVEVVHAGLNKPAYGRPEENSMTLLSVQPESSARPVSELLNLSSLGRPVNPGKGNSMPLVQQRRSVGIAEVELIVEVHAIEHNALGKRVSKLQGNVLCHAALQLYEERIVMVLRRADEFVDPTQVGVDAAFGQQTIVHIGQGDGRLAARYRTS